jgi:hypothetical protein
VEEPAPLENRLLATQTDRTANERKELPLRWGQVPDEPAQLVVLTIRVVVALLALAELIACQDHGDALRQHQRQDEIALLALPQL